MYMLWDVIPPSTALFLCTGMFFAHRHDASYGLLTELLCYHMLCSCQRVLLNIYIGNLVLGNS